MVFGNLTESLMFDISLNCTPALHPSPNSATGNSARLSPGDSLQDPELGGRSILSLQTLGALPATSPTPRELWKNAEAGKWQGSGVVSG